MAGGVDIPPWRARFESDRLCVLGRVGLLISGREYSLSGMPARLVTLLCCSDDPWVSLDELVESLWAGAPPDTARPALHVHLGAVRRWLAQYSCGVVIEKSSVGYRINLGDLELDYTLMVDLVEQARSRLQTAPGDVVEILRCALSLPRGRLGGVANNSDGMVFLSQRLDGLRLSGEEDLVEALLATGSFQAAEVEAVRLVEESPFREVRWAQLMRALYLDNRPHEALATYRTVRALFVDEFGTEPGPLLQKLERMVLIHDANGLASSPQRPAMSATPPPVAGPIIGREAELRRCAEALAAQRVVAIHGMPGVGKTRLVQEICQLANAARSVVWVDLQADTDPVRATALAFGASPDSGLSHICELLDGLPALVVLDNAGHASPAVEQVVTGLHRVLPELQILITSRVRLSLPGVYVALKPLPLPGSDDTDEEIEANPSVLLLRDALEDLAPTVRLTRDELLQVCAGAGGLPLALRLAAGELRALGTTARVHIAEVAVSSKLGPVVAATLGLLPVPQQQAFASSAILVGGFDAGCGAAVAGMPVEEFVASMVGLVDSGLVDMMPGPPARYRILSPLRDAIGDLIDERSRQQALHRLVDYGITEARAIGRGIRLGEPVDDVEPRTIGMISVANTAIGHLATTGDADRALELAGRLDAALYVLGWWTEKNQLLDRAIAIPGPPSAVRARALALRGRAGVLSQFDLDYLTEAEEMATALGDDMLAAYSGHLRGIALWWHGEYEASLAANRSAIERFSAAGRTIEELEARKFVGLALLQSGHIDDGLREQHDVLAGFERLGIAFHVAHSLALLGHSYRYLGDDDAAAVDLEASLNRCRLIGNRGTAIHVHLGLGDIAVDGGAFERSQRHATEAMGLITRSRLRTYEPWAWTLATRVAALTGDFERAKGCGRKALSALEFAPGGDAARLAFELAEVALQLDDPRRAARLIGAARRQTVPREMPLSSPLDEQRYTEITDRAMIVLGQDTDHHLTAGRRCTVAEAAGDLLQ